MFNKTRRNGKDVIMELVHLHLQQAEAEGRKVSSGELKDIYLKYYGLYTNRHEELKDYNRR